MHIYIYIYIIYHLELEILQQIKGKKMRKSSVDKNGVKKGAWSEEEDSKLRSYVLRYGHWNWRLLPEFAGN